MRKTLIITLVCISYIFAQTKDAYNGNESKSGGFLDPSHFSINHSISFGAASTDLGFSSVKSQSLYTTMLQYKFNAPVTLNLDFGLPIFSTFSSTQNLTTQNIKSLDYFKSMPFDFSLSWQPLQNCYLQFRVCKYTEDPLTSQYYPYSYFHNSFPGHGF